MKTLFEPAGQVIGWTLLLALILPGIAHEWPWWWLLPGLAPIDYLSTPIGILYATLCIMIILAFIALATRRRTVLGLLLLLMIAVQWSTQAIGWERIATYLTVLCVGVFLVEAWRQNRALYHALKADEINALRLLWQALYLWSPLLLIIGLGFYGNHLLLKASEEVIYSVTPVDRYCEAQAAEQSHIIPCSGLTEQVTAADVAERPLEETLRLHIGDRFSEALRQSLQQIGLGSDGGIDPVSEAKTASDWLEFAETLTASAILGLPNQPDPAVAAIRSDATLKSLQKRLRQANQTLATFERNLTLFKKNPFFGDTLLNSMRKTPVYEQMKQTRQGLITSIKKREQEIRAAAADSEAAQADGRYLKPRRQLVKALGRFRLDGKELLVLSGRQDAAARARLALHLMRQLDALEAQTLKTTLATLTSKTNRPLAYGTLYTNPWCSTERENPEVLDADGEPTRINQEPFPCFPLEGDAGVAITALELVESTNHSIDRWQLERERQLTAQFRTLAQGSYRSAAAVQEKAAEITNAVPDTIDLGRKSCHVLLRPGNCVTNYVKSEAESAYELRQAEFEQGTQQLVAEQTGNAAGSAEEQLLLTRAQMYSGLDASTSYLRSAVSGLQQLGQLIAALLNALLIMAIIKSYLYVLATRVFDARSQFHIDLGASDPAQGSYISAPNIEIPRSFKPALITKDVLDNQEVSTSIAPWPRSAPVARILLGAYFGFNRGSHFDLSEQSMSFSRANGHDVIDWQMQPGEEVVFHYRNFFGASENVQLKTTISLRLSTLLLGRLVFHSAVCTEGEGRLLLTSAGTVRDQSKTDSTTLPRLIAWNRHTRFRVASQGTMRSVLLDGYAIVRTRGETGRDGLIVVEAIQEGRSKVVGSLRFVRNLLLPF